VKAWLRNYQKQNLSICFFVFHDHNLAPHQIGHFWVDKWTNRFVLVFFCLFVRLAI
jgi:hypothetical protein